MSEPGGYSSPVAARTGPVGRVWRCPFMRVDRKSPAQGQTGAIDPIETWEPLIF